MLDTKECTCAVDDLLDELAIKYLLNLPEEEYSNEVQLCYAFQVAHWEYLDAPETEHLHNKLSFSNFVINILDRTPELGLNKADVPVRLDLSRSTDSGKLFQKLKRASCAEDCIHV